MNIYEYWFRHQMSRITRWGYSEVWMTFDGNWSIAALRTQDLPTITPVPLASGPRLRKVFADAARAAEMSAP